MVLVKWMRGFLPFELSYWVATWVLEVCEAPRSSSFNVRGLYIWPENSLLLLRQRRWVGSTRPLILTWFHFPLHRIRLSYVRLCLVFQLLQVLCHKMMGLVRSAGSLEVWFKLIVSTLLELLLFFKQFVNNPALMGYHRFKPVDALIRVQTDYLLCKLRRRCFVW